MWWFVGGEKNLQLYRQFIPDHGNTSQSSGCGFTSHCHVSSTRVEGWIWFFSVITIPSNNIKCLHFKRIWLSWMMPINFNWIKLINDLICTCPLIDQCLLSAISNHPFAHYLYLCVWLIVIRSMKCFNLMLSRI